MDDIALGMWGVEDGEPRFKVVGFYQPLKTVRLRSLDVSDSRSYSAQYHEAGGGLTGGRSFEAGWYIGPPMDGRRLVFHSPKTSVMVPNAE